jgi:hypothetical protein
MIAALQDLLNVHLLPFALAVPLALLLFLLVWRHGDSRHADAGSRFVAQTPSPPSDAAVVPPATPATQAAARSVLIVDDSAVARAKLRKLFESAGYEMASKPSRSWAGPWWPWSSPTSRCRAWMASN